MDDLDAEERDVLADTWRGVVQERLESLGWWGHVSGYSLPGPRLWLRPDAPAEIEGCLADLVAQGLVVERGVLTIQWE